MEIGVGLPNAIPDTQGRTILDWARRADEGPFSSVGVVDRVRYNSYEPMVTLAAASGVTGRVGLVSMVLIAPLRNTALLAKEATTIDALSGGRLTLGVAVGARTDDYVAAGASSSGRGDRLEEQLVELRLLWERGDITPRATGGLPPRVLVGGTNDFVFARLARYADGYVHGGGPPRTFERAAAKARTAWSEFERPAAPALWAQGYFALGDEDVVERGRAYMRDYYGFTGPFAVKIADQMLATPHAVAQFVRGYAEAGCDELVLFPAVADLEQLDRLQDALSEV